ncbi:OsmC family peroxiredoxin [Komagataeibacter rhaeticus]|uniref:OsmC family peroxiredoxin n=1 Tax=Komagataeibacter rhaeticus TaxID=215221 RepID=A0A181CB63_9PROT|nr:OsmC family peroxiredoxin [Komagataeibacter rhaeticus]ATU72549.1 OsmC family peroxiredoxin [Komagataeibacter xylinus]EGG74525.1 Peroxiredoxin osmC [Gluconacetobacter sp. SXCC-1]KDU94577.1 peroxiredoxin OsmC [Komagataeibacter rhaeticus AF1]MBL7238637.1 OsmC family peroxiredoxin [Komagataeibacter rhaeticus]PYD53667.1 OsmC family peroxiredoxin [Komagataeibacter rhaeticus]
MAITKYATAHWSGGLKDGRGEISTQSGSLRNQPYGFNTRFEGSPGTNPEELLGAAHAACFAMALSGILGGAGLTATSLDAKSEIVLEKQGEGFAITAAKLTLEAAIPNATEEQFRELAEKAKAGCPVSKLFNATITLDAKLKG